MLTKTFFLLVIIVCGAFSVFAQTNGDDDDTQFWNDLQLTVPMTKKVDFFTQITGRFDDNISRFSDERFELGFVLKPTKSFSVTPFYWYVNARNASGKFRVENQLNLRAVYRFPTRGFGLSHRSQYEYRIRRPRNSWRYRAMLTIDKKIPEKIIPKAKFFASDEVFYDSILKKFNRNRFSAGITKTINKNLSVDIYYMRQNDGYSHPGDLNIIGTAWKVHL